MAKDRSLVRASDIGAWTFCHRAWWLAQIKEVPHQNPQDLARGDDAHRQHGRLVTRAHQLHHVGWILVALGLILLGLIGGIWVLFSG